MAKGRRGETRPADAVKRAVHIVKIATGEIEDDVKPPSPKAKGWQGARREDDEKAASGQRQEGCQG